MGSGSKFPASRATQYHSPIPSATLGTGSCPSPLRAGWEIATLYATLPAQSMHKRRRALGQNQYIHGCGGKAGLASKRVPPRGTQ
jgi:hypothetical protein